MEYSRSSRETSPAGGGFKTVGIPTYLRTCNAYKHSFTKVCIKWDFKFGVKPIQTPFTWTPALLFKRQIDVKNI